MTRVVGLDAGAWTIPQHWLNHRMAAGINGRNPVFCVPEPDVSSSE